MRLANRLTFVPLLWGLLASPAYADYEYWGWYETRIPLVSKLPGTSEPVQLRLFTDQRFGLRYPGLGWQFFRLGPLWGVTPWCFIGTHFTTVAVQSAPSAFIQEYRGEVEPNFFGRLGDVTWNDRNRLEYRWRWNDAHFRYRNQLKLAYAPPGATWVPFIWEEPLIELNAQGFAQNRAEIGLGRQLTDALRFDVGLMLRSRANTTGGWDQDYVLNTYLYFAPKADPAFGQETGE